MPNRKDSTPSKQRVLILQGGGSLGAYEAGVFKALYERLYRPNEPLFDIVAGTSIGAINAAILVSYVVKNRGSWEGAPERLDEFWDYVSTSSYPNVMPGFRDWWNYWHSFYPSVASGEAARRYYSAKQFGVTGTPAVFMPEIPSFDTRFFDLFNTWYHYDNNPLRKSLQRFTDFPIATDYNKENPQPRLLVISTDIQECKAVTFDSYPKEIGGIRKTEYGDYKSFSGNYERFDHIIKYDKGITSDFVIASASVPITYHYTVIGDVDSASCSGQNNGIKNKRYFWDGGILSNTPIRETLQAHQDYWVKVKGEQKPPDLEVYIIDLYASKQNYIPQDFDGVLNIVSDIEFHDRNIHDIKTSEFIADYIDMTNELTELAKSKGATQQEIDRIMNKDAHSKHRTGKPRTYKDLLIGQFKIENVVRIIRKNDPNTIFNKALDFSRDTIQNLRNEGYYNGGGRSIIKHLTAVDKYYETQYEKRLSELLLSMKFYPIFVEDNFYETRDLVRKLFRKEAPFIPGKMKAGELVRESPPIEEYKNLQRNVIKAKLSSPYLKDALENPTFDMEKVYELTVKE